MSGAAPATRLERALRTTLSQLIGSARDTSALTRALDRALRDDPDASVIAARILDELRADATHDSRAAALREHLERASRSAGSRESARESGRADPRGTTTSDSTDGSANLSGTVLKGRFVLKQPIGRGSTGVVYRAQDRRPGSHPAQIAVKVLHAELQREQVTLARIRQAFALSQSLDHPNIARVCDFYRNERHAFYTMELLDGESLRRLIELLGAEPFTLEEVTPIIRDVGAALAFAHRRGAVHGDLQPGNVVVSGDLSAKVLDFGLTRAAYALLRRRATHPPPAITPARGYASSDVLAGSAPGATDDVYSFACMCYELLAGHLPFGVLDALAARDAGLVPVRIERLADASWEALAQGLALSARDRRIRVEELVARLCADARPPLAEPLPLPPPPGAAPAARQRSRDGRRRVRGRASRSPPWLAIALVAGVAVTLGGAYLAADRNARVERVNAMLASRAAGAQAPGSERGASSARGTDESVRMAASTSTAPPSRSAVAVREETAASGTNRVGATAFAFPKRRYAASEGRSLVAIPIERRDVAGPATVVWWTVEGDAHAHEDFAWLGRRTESFAHGEKRRYIRIPVVSDRLTEGDEGFYVELALPDSADVALARTEVVIRDDDY
jgi:serine/threonine protein kinase